MITKLEAFITKLSKVKGEFDKIVLNQVQKIEEEIIDLNVAQLDAGINSRGVKITPEYDQVTISIKQGKGQPTDRVTLEDEGDFKRGFFIIYGSDYFQISSEDKKTDFLINRYGPEVFGLTPQSLFEVRELIREDLIQDVRSRLL